MTDTSQIHTEIAGVGNAEELKCLTVTDCRRVGVRQPCQKPTTESTATSAMTVHRTQPKATFSN